MAKVQSFFCNCSGVHDALHRGICELLRAEAGQGNTRLLDIGCWAAEHTIGYATSLNLKPDEVFGIEGNPGQFAIAKERIQCSLVDLEVDRFPFEDESFDVVVANQVFEHLKNVFLPMSEIWRVLKPQGRLIFSVPNLSSAHNRLLVLLGRQPTSIRIMGPHVRAFAFQGVTDFLQLNRKFTIESSVGVGFYPSPAILAPHLARLFKGMSHSVIWVAKKQPSKANDWNEEIKQMGDQSDFFD
jgi:SAM-dependent methyltransferase